MTEIPTSIERTQEILRHSQGVRLYDLHWTETPKHPLLTLLRCQWDEFWRPNCNSCGRSIPIHRHRSNYDGLILVKQFGPISIIQEGGGCFGPDGGCPHCGEDGAGCNGLSLYTYVKWGKFSRINCSRLLQRRRPQSLTKHVR